MKQKLAKNINHLFISLKTLFSILLFGLFCIGLISLVFFLFLQILQNSRIDDTVYDSFFNISIYNLLENVFFSFLIVFEIHLSVIIALHLFYKMTKFNTIKLQEYSWKLYIPLWITLWLTMSLDENGFAIVTSVISFLALLSPLIKTPKLSSSSESEIHHDDEE